MTCVVLVRVDVNVTDEVEVDSPSLAPDAGLLTDEELPPAGLDAELVKGEAEEVSLTPPAGVDEVAAEPDALDDGALAGPELEDAGPDGEALPAGPEVDAPEAGVEDVLAGAPGELEDGELEAGEPEDGEPAPPGMELVSEGTVAILDLDERVTVEVPLKVEVIVTVLVERVPTLLLLPAPVTASPVVLLVPGKGGITPLSADAVDSEVRVRGQMVVETATTEVVSGQSVTPGPQSRTVMYEVLSTVETETAGNSCTTATLVTTLPLSSVAAVSMVAALRREIRVNSPVAFTDVNAPAAARVTLLNCIVLACRVCV